MHEIKSGDKDALAVRAFIPGATEISVYDPKIPDKKYKMELIHKDGFFETVITDRKNWFRYMLDVEQDGKCWQTYDAYSFEPVLSDFDILLFSQGTHYNIFDKLGSHVMEIDGVKGTLFAVWAPNARRVSVVGDFNNWDGRRHSMRLLQSSGIWEIFIPSVQSGDKYKYEIKTVNNTIIYKTDPYGNYAELRPDTASIVFDINNYQWNDSKWNVENQCKDKFNIPMNIYEVQLGS
jgi:1,4-alpha-glucan branching enzyme